MRGGDLRELRERWAVREADDAEVRLVHPQQHGRLRAGCPLVVGRARPVRRSHLDEARARARQYVRDAEAVADLDQLPARDEHLATLGKRRQRQQHRGRVVVDDERCLGARQPAEDPCDMILTRAAAALCEVVFEVRVAASNLRDALESRGRQRSAAEVRMRDHARGVDRGAQAVRVRGSDLLRYELRELARILTGANLCARSVEHCAGGLDREPVRRRAETRVAQQLVHRGQLAQLHAESVGISSRKSATSEPAASAPTASTCSWSIGSGETPAARFVTHETARQRMPMCRAASTSGTVDMPTMSAPSTRSMRISAGVSNAGPSQAAYTPSPRSTPSRSAAARAAARSVRVVRVRQVRKARSEALVVRADQRRLPLEVEVIGDDDELPGLEVVVDRPDRVREHERAHAEQPEHADPEDDLCRRESLVQMRPAAHHGHGHAAERPDDEHAGVPDGRGHRPARDVLVRDLDRVL